MNRRPSYRSTLHSEIESNTSIIFPPPSPSTPYNSTTSPLLPTLLYSLSSSSLLLLNKLLLTSLPLPSTLLTLQLLFTILSLYILSSLSLFNIDTLKLDILKIYSVYTILFTSGIVCSLQCLRETSVESVVMVKSLSPIGVCALERVLEWVGWGEKNTIKEGNKRLNEIGRRRVLGLIMVGLGGGMYGWKGGMGRWCLGYWGCLGVEMVVGRRIVKGIPFQTPSGPVQYTNLLALLPSIFFSLSSGELSTLLSLSSSHPSLLSFLLSFPWTFYLYLILSLLMGSSIGYTSWWTRSQVSATSYTLIGILSKMGSIVGSSLVWGGRSGEELGGLGLSLGGGVVYAWDSTKGLDVDKSNNVDKKKTVERSSK